MSVISEPTPWQEELCNFPDDMNLAVFGGRGAGRTTGALFCASSHIEMYGPRAHVLFIRQTLRSLREVEDNFQQILMVAFHGLKFNRQDHEFRFPNGATAEFAPINDTEDMAKLQGRSFSLIIADEYGNFSPQQMRFVDQLRANLRAGNKKDGGAPTRMILLANPGGRGHSLIKQRYIDKLTPLRMSTLDDGMEWIWVPANYKVNPHNPDNYLGNLEASAHKDKELLRAWVDGAWNIARGAMFADCIDEEFHKIRFADLPWQKNAAGVFVPDKRTFGFLSSDWGQSAPAVSFACRKMMQAVGIFPKGSVVLVDEVTSADPDDWSVGMNWSLGKFADAMQDMVERTGVHKVGCIDDAKGLSPDDTLIKGMANPPYLFSFIRPQKNRRSGWATIREMLTNAKERNGRPGLWASDRCKGFWATVPDMPRDPLNMEDVDTRSVDHWGDTARYAVTYEVGVVTINNAKATAQRFGIGGPQAPRLY
jgi:hypothetical protein